MTLRRRGLGDDKTEPEGVVDTFWSYLLNDADSLASGHDISGVKSITEEEQRRRRGRNRRGDDVHSDTEFELGHRRLPGVGSGSTFSRQNYAREYDMYGMPTKSPQHESFDNKRSTINTNPPISPNLMDSFFFGDTFSSRDGPQEELVDPSVASSRVPTRQQPIQGKREQVPYADNRHRPVDACEVTFLEQLFGDILQSRKPPTLQIPASPENDESLAPSEETFQRKRSGVTASRSMDLATRRRTRSKRDFPAKPINDIRTPDKRDFPAVANYDYPVVPKIDSSSSGFSGPLSDEAKSLTGGEQFEVEHEGPKRKSRFAMLKRKLSFKGRKPTNTIEHDEERGVRSERAASPEPTLQVDLQPVSVHQQTEHALSMTPAPLTHQADDEDDANAGEKNLEARDERNIRESSSERNFREVSSEMNSREVNSERNFREVGTERNSRDVNSESNFRVGDVNSESNLRVAKNKSNIGETKSESNPQQEFKIDDLGNGLMALNLNAAAAESFKRPPPKLLACMAGNEIEMQAASISETRSLLSRIRSRRKERQSNASSRASSSLTGTTDSILVQDMKSDRKLISSSHADEDVRVAWKFENLPSDNRLQLNSKACFLRPPSLARSEERTVSKESLDDRNRKSKWMSPIQTNFQDPVRSFDPSPAHSIKTQDMGALTNQHRLPAITASQLRLPASVDQYRLPDVPPTLYRRNSPARPVHDRSSFSGFERQYDVPQDLWSRTAASRGASSAPQLGVSSQIKPASSPRSISSRQSVPRKPVTPFPSPSIASRHSSQQRKPVTPSPSISSRHSSQRKPTFSASSTSSRKYSARKPVSQSRTSRKSRENQFGERSVTPSLSSSSQQRRALRNDEVSQRLLSSNKPSQPRRPSHREDRSCQGSTSRQQYTYQRNIKTPQPVLHPVKKKKQDWTGHEGNSVITPIVPFFPLDPKDGGVQSDDSSFEGDDRNITSFSDDEFSPDEKSYSGRNNDGSVYNRLTIASDVRYSAFNVQETSWDRDDFSLDAMSRNL